jgi:hypothetical protein
MNFPELLDSYCDRGGKDLGEFLMGSQGRRDVNPPPQAGYFLGDFDGVMAKVGGKFPRLCEALGGMKGSSLKRMIAENHIANGEVVAKMAEALGIAAGSREDARLWHMARGDKPALHGGWRSICKSLKAR